MTSVTPGPIDPQSASPLFTLIPAEIRNLIFELALTAYDDKTKPYKNGEYYYRPGHRYAHRVDTNLLLTCRRVWTETKNIPASINEYTCWLYRPPPWALIKGLTRLLEDSVDTLVRRRELKYVHLFTQQVWLESRFGDFTQLWQSARPTHLKITLRHSDWWYWENELPLALDPKYHGRPSAMRFSKPSDPFAERSWGSSFQKIIGLKEFQLELETVEKKKDELDAIVARAPGWQFVLGDGRTMVLNESKTRRTGWMGRRLASHPQNSEKAPFAAKERLLKQGVTFEDEALETGLAEDQFLTYYVVTLTWYARPAECNSTGQQPSAIGLSELRISDNLP